MLHPNEVLFTRNYPDAPNLDYNMICVLFITHVFDKPVSQSWGSARALNEPMIQTENVLQDVWIMTLPKTLYNTDFCQKIYPKMYNIL